MESKNIKDLSVTELKAVAYDNLLNIENSQRTLQAINQEIASRSTVPVSETKES